MTNFAGSVFFSCFSRGCFEIGRDFPEKMIRSRGIFLGVVLWVFSGFVLGLCVFLV